MTVEQFFDLFVEELKNNEDLQYYYKYLENPAKFEFRKAYFCQRLQYTADNITDPTLRIWDCGCGFGTTAIFLSINGIASHGTTLEHYIHQIPKRLKYWGQFGDVSKFTYSYENIFDHKFEANSYDLIIIQDTLHHLEPLNEALQILHHVLSPKGRLLIIEENGNNVIRSLATWQEEFQKEGFSIEQDTVQYIRYYLPFAFPNKKAKERVEKEQLIWKKNKFLKEYFFFGINYMVEKV